MGQKNHVMNHYFRNKERFADLFNGVYFQGDKVINSEDLTEISGVYEETEDSLLWEQQMEEWNDLDKESLTPPLRKLRSRDIEMCLSTGEVFRLLAIENQKNVNYIMPFRCMQYDTLEYSRQIADLQAKNSKAHDYETGDEWLCRVKKTDRLTPVYTLCVYHGEDDWDGPRSLKDMMDFGEDSDGMSRYFADYPLHLYCINEQEAFDTFHTEIKELFQLMKFRKDKKRLQQEMEGNPKYQRMDIESLEVLSVMLNAPKIWKERGKYMNTEHEREECNMCQALREWIEEERSLGWAEGAAKGKAEGKVEGKAEELRLIVTNMLRRGMSDEDIMALAECNQEYVDEVRKAIR